MRNYKWYLGIGGATALWGIYTLFALPQYPSLPGEVFGFAFVLAVINILGGAALSALTVYKMRGDRA